MANQEEVNYMQQLEDELTQAKSDKQQLAQGQMSLFAPEEQDNLIRWQLDLREDLDRLYHLLKGDKIGEDESGNMAYIPADDPNLKPFNEYGVQLIMNIMSFYLNRNTILSNYDEKTIQWKVYDFGQDLADLIHNKYEDMMVTIYIEKGEDPEAFQRKVEIHLSEKIKLFPMMVRELVDTIHSAYLRAYHGGERESLRTARTVTQSEPIGVGRMGYQSPPAYSAHKKFQVLHPSTWGK